MADNETEWNKNLNFVCLAFNTAVHESTRLTPFEMTFGRKGKNLKKGKVAVQKTQERLKKQQDGRSVISNPLFDLGDLVLLHNDNKQSKLERE